MNILIVDGQGGGVGKSLVARLKEALPGAQICAVGTNSIASSAMKKAGADIVATGENAVKVNSRKADVIAGPVGIVAADSLYGEITGAMAEAIGQSDAVKVLLPFNNCGIFIAGCDDVTPGILLEKAVKKIVEIAGESGFSEKK